MVVMILESVAPSARGELTRWLFEPHAGVFVGNVSALVREKLWEMVCTRIKPGSGGMLIHSVATEQGFTIRTHGDIARNIADFDGLILVSKPSAKTRKKSKDT